MKRTFKIFVSFILILAFSCTVDQVETAPEEEALEAISLRHRTCRSEITVEVIECGVYRITSDKRITRIVYRVDGVDTEIRPDCDRTYDLCVDDVTDIWVQTRRHRRSRWYGHGRHGSGDDDDAPHGEHFTVDDSEFCDEESTDGSCDDDTDCSQGSCGEGGLCTSAVGGRIFLDANGDGIFTAGESGAVAGVQLQVNTIEGWVDFSFDVTEDSGFYNFDLLNPLFEYRISVRAPAGTTFEYTAQNAGDDDTLDSDVNAEGISDAVQPGPDKTDTTVWAGVLPEVVDPPTGACERDEDCTTTGSCGEGGLCTSNVGGRIFIDANGDGIFNAGDSGAVAGVYLQVLAPVGWIDYGFDATDENGFYLFGLLNVSINQRYRIRLIAPPGDPAFVYTLQNEGADDSIDSDIDPTDGFSDAVQPDPDTFDNTLWAGILPK